MRVATYRPTQDHQDDSMYIYTIKNLINGKMYVGQTIQANAKMRWYSHLDYARKGKKSHLYDSMRKHGVENFVWKVVDCADTIDQLNDLETAWADRLRAQGKILFNNRQTGGNKRHSAASIEKMRQVHKQRHANNHIGGWKRRDGGPMKGKTQSRVVCLSCRKNIAVNAFFRNHNKICNFKMIGVD